MKTRSGLRRIVALVYTPTLLVFVLMVFCSPGRAQEKIILKEVKIAGNLRVEEDGIRLHVKNRAGDPFNQAVVEQDVKSIYRMGFFDDVQAELSPQAVLTYTVKEKPYVREIRIQGNSQISRDKIETALGVTPRTILDRGRGRDAGIAGAKIYISESAMHIGQEAVQLHGGIGTTEELLVGQAFKRVLALAALFGDADTEVDVYVRLTGS